MGGIFFGGVSRDFRTTLVTYQSGIEDIPLSGYPPITSYYHLTSQSPTLYIGIRPPMAFFQVLGSRTSRFSGSAIWFGELGLNLWGARAQNAKS